MTSINTKSGDGSVELIFIHGAPGSGKSTLSSALQKKLKSPMFEFGWIPEFRERPGKVLAFKEEESLAFENLVLVVKNYIKHGFINIIITDLRDPKIRLVQKIFRKNKYIIVTLWTNDDQKLKARVLDESRSSGYRNWESSIRLNRIIKNRPLLSNEYRIDATTATIEAEVNAVSALLGKARLRTVRRKLPAKSHFYDELSGSEFGKDPK
jgi:hypothetical protein